MTYNRFRLTAANGSNDINHNPTMYVSMPANGGNDNNSGTTAEAPLATVQRAVDKIKDDYDTSGFAPVIKLGDGQHRGWQDWGPCVGRHKKGGGPIIYLGNLSNPEAVRIYHDPGVAVVSLDGYAQAVIVGMRIDANQATAVYATTGSIIELGLVTVSGSVPILAEADGKIYGTSTLKFIGPMVYGLQANKGALVEVVPGVIIQFEDSIFAQHFLFGVNHGTVIVPYRFHDAVYDSEGWVTGGTHDPIGGVTFQGSFVGRKAYASLLGIANSGYRTLNMFPGTVNAGFNAGGELN